MLNDVFLVLKTREYNGKEPLTPRHPKPILMLPRFNHTRFRLFRIQFHRGLVGDHVRNKKSLIVIGN